MRRVKVLRSFMFDGKAQEVGATVELPDRLAGEVVSSQKAEYVKDAPAASGEPAAAPAAPVRGKSKGKE